MKRGFTLFELVATLTLIAVLAVFGGMMLTSSIQIFLAGREAAANNQTAEIALARIVKELTWADPETIELSSSGKTIRWRSRHPDRRSEKVQELSWDGLSGSDLLLSGKPLIDRVEIFQISKTVETDAVSIHFRTSFHPETYQTRIHFQEKI